MMITDNLKQLKVYQACRRGEDKRSLADTDLTPTVIGLALDWAIAQIEAQQPQPDAWKNKIDKARDEAKAALDEWIDAEGE
jgi:hypothetical protein